MGMCFASLCNYFFFLFLVGRGDEELGRKKILDNGKNLILNLKIFKNRQKSCSSKSNISTISGYTLNIPPSKSFASAEGEQGVFS